MDQTIIPPSPDYEVVVIGAGVGGIYQIKRLDDLGVKATVLELAGGLGGTWYWNRYPGARFDSESYTYGYSFSRELLDEWHWKERFSGQPENLRYLNHVADKFDLGKYMQFNCRVVACDWDERARLWRLTVRDERTGADERVLTCRFMIMTLGLLSQPTLPRLPGKETFKGPSFHTYYWPQEGVELAGKKVAVIGTGATAIQVIGEIADKVGQLTVFQRRPNWSAPLNNSEISEAEMADIRRRYDEIFAACARSPGGFEHEPDRRGFYEVSREERLKLWDRLYDEPGFGIWLANFREIFMDEAANAELSAYIAERIRRRVKDPRVAEKLIPKDHGFGIQLFRGLQPAERAPGRPAGDAARTGDGEGAEDDGARVRVRHHRLCHRLRRHHGGLRSYRHTRNWRSDIAREVEGFVLDLPRHDGARLPQHADAGRAAVRLSLDQLSARHRDRRQLEHRFPAIRMEERHHALRGDGRGRGALDRPRRRHVLDDADAQGQGLVHRLQLQRRRPRRGQGALLRLQRRRAQVREPHHRLRRERV
jgi:cation diffusion facilitator CzcD-associated flavoprotein CzcO